MSGPTPAVAAVRAAVRADLNALVAAVGPGSGAVRDPDGARASGPLVLVACSGGPDSLALAGAAAFVGLRLGFAVGAVVVDHGLQPGSDDVARRAAEQCRDLGLDPVEVEAVTVGRGGEAAARDARYAALGAVALRTGARAVLLGHTMDDQAEGVLLALGRGSGARSLAGMPAVRGLLRRPLLTLRRSLVAGACADMGLVPWHDPTNAGGNRRARIRSEVLPVLEDAVGPGVAEALARTADQLRADAEVLEGLAAELLDAARRGSVEDPRGLDAAVLSGAPVALRTRALRAALLEWGCSPGSVSAAHIAAVDALVVAWKGQGPVDVPGVRVHRRCGRLSPEIGGRHAIGSDGSSSGRS